MWFRSGGGVNKFWRVIFSPKQDNHTDVYISLSFKDCRQISDKLALAKKGS